MPLPVIGRDKDGQFFIIAKIASNDTDGDDNDQDEEKILVQSPLSQKPQILEKEQFLVLWSGDVVLMTTRAMIAGAARKFDVTWFIPAIVKYRKILYEILLASFFLQLFALMTPMFFQVEKYNIKDKEFDATVRCKNYSKVLESIFGDIDNFTLKLNGHANEDFTIIDAEGYMADNPVHLIQLRLKRIAELP